MLTVRAIEMLLNQKDHRGLVRRVLQNGRTSQQDCSRIGPAQIMRSGTDEGMLARGLGLQRVCELTYGPTPLADRIAAELVTMVNDRMYSARNRRFWEKARPLKSGSVGRSAGPTAGHGFVAIDEAMRGLELLRRHYEAVGRAAPEWLEVIDVRSMAADQPRHAA